ncbi:damage-inducible protein [Sinorhizobium meliloti]|uniref:damage-inducible protein n=1 Tax=Rhizobium meliloti TaxID=382 RepID=UPI0018E043A9|nr:damage-inducible protein [Sinorhizobium meliloti]
MSERLLLIALLALGPFRASQRHTGRPALLRRGPQSAAGAVEEHFIQLRAPLWLITLGGFSHREAHDAWFRAKVLRALENTRPDADDADADAHFQERRAAALRKAAAGDR